MLFFDIQNWKHCFSNWKKKIIASDVTKSGLLEGILQSDILAQKSKLFQCVYTLLFFLFKIHVLLIFSYIKSDITWFHMISKKNKLSLCVMF